MTNSGKDRKYSQVNENEVSIEDELDLSLIFIILLKNIRKLTLFGFIGFFISCIIALGTKKTWQGNFQIVLEENESVNLSNIAFGNQTLADYSSVLGLNTGNQGLRTQVEILKSPSVLLNIFNYVNEQKGLVNEKQNKIRFVDWKKKNLNINLQKNTSILSINYEDNSKELILPVLKKISKTYQEYSGSERIRNIDLANQYFSEQIAFYKLRSESSLRQFQEFAIDNDLPINLANDFENGEDSDLDFEAQRVKASNQIRFFNKQLAKLKKIQNDSDEIFYFASGLPIISSPNNQIYASLNDVILDLVMKNDIYTEDDILIKTLKEQKVALLKDLKLQMVGYFNSSIDRNSAIIGSTSRSKEVILNYMDLLRNANLANKTLINLETQFQLLKLEQSRYKDPWKLITEPTVLPYAVKPKKRNIALLGGFTGLLVGSLIIGINEKNKGILYTEKGLNNILRGNFSEILYFDDSVNWYKKIIPINRTILNKVKDEILFLVVGNITEEKVKFIEERLEKNIENKNIFISNDPNKVFNYENFVLISYLGITNEEEIGLISKNLSLENKSILGHLIICDKINLLNKLKLKNNFVLSGF